MEDLKQFTLQKAEELALEISNSEKGKKYLTAKRKFLEDEPTRKLYDKFYSVNREYQILKQSNVEQIELVNQLRELQRQLLSNPIFSELLGAQEEFINFLKELNAEISANLMFDFAAFAKN